MPSWLAGFVRFLPMRDGQSLPSLSDDNNNPAGWVPCNAKYVVIMKTNEVSIGWALTQPDRAALLQQVWNNVMTWGRQRSETFSMLAGEPFTHAEVVKGHALCLLLLALIGIGGAL